MLAANTLLAVTVGGQEVAMHTWQPTYILAALPGHGPGSAGDVVVSARNHRSNAAPLSEWRGHVHWRVDYNTYLVPTEGLVAEGDCQFQLRADYHAFRPEPAEDAQNADAEVVGGQDSRCTWQMSGDVTWTSLGDVYRGVLRGCSSTNIGMQTINRSPRRNAYTCHRGRYCTASARCAVSIRSAPAGSAIVRASLSVR